MSHTWQNIAQVRSCKAFSLIEVWPGKETVGMRSTHGQCASKKIAASCLSTSPLTLRSAATLRSSTNSASGLACRRPVTSAAISGRDAKALLTCTQQQ